MGSSYILPYLPITSYSVEHLFSMHSKANRSLARLDGLLRKRNYANALHEDTAAWEQWLLFFLQAVDAQAKENMRRATIYHLRELSLIAQGLPIGRFDY